jgi:hypothetical protein
MSITIQQYPGQLNLANSDMIWEVTSNSSSNAQYQFITNLQDGCGNVLTSVKQQPNPYYKGVFNLGRITKQYLGFDTAQFNMGADSLFYKNTNTAKFFKVAFGEQYGTSVSSSVSVYNGITNAATGLFRINKQIINIDANTYIYDIELIKSDGTIKTYISGNFYVTNDVTR